VSRYAKLTMPMIRRMQALRDVGLSIEATRRVIELDYGQAPCSRTIENYTAGRFDGKGMPKGGAGGYAGISHTPVTAFAKKGRSSGLVAGGEDKSPPNAGKIHV
jgi:hypothetical protein